MTDIIERQAADHEGRTVNLAVARLRAQEYPQNLPTIYNAARLRAAETIIMRPDEGAVIVTGEIPRFIEEAMQEPPVGTPPPLPPIPPAEPQPKGYRGQRRRPVPLWVHAAGYAGTCLLGAFGGAVLMLVTLTASGHVW